MADNEDLFAVVKDGATVRVLYSSGRDAIRASTNLDELIALRAHLRILKAGRGLWFLWTWLLILSGGAISITVGESGGALVIVAIVVAIVAVGLIINYVSRLRQGADRAEDWLSEIDFRLQQLAGGS